MLPYKLEDEFRDRYLHTIITFKGEPVYITDVYRGRSRDAEREGEIKFIYAPLPYDYNRESKQVRELATHPDFSDSFENLGYANAFSTISYSGEDLIKYGVYITRIPVRRNKQGLFSENLHIPKNTGRSFLDLMYQTEFVDMLQGKYPSFESVKQLIIAEHTKYGIMGFSPQFALEFNKLEQVVLYCRTDPVGFSLDGGDSFQLIKSKKWLIEAVEEKGLRVKTT